MQAYSVPCWWVIWWLWRAGCISQDTYLLYLKSDSLQLACVQPPTSLQVRTLRLFKQVIWGDIWQLPLERNATDRTGRICRTIRKNHIKTWLPWTLVFGSFCNVFPMSPHLATIWTFLMDSRAGLLDSFAPICNHRRHSGDQKCQ